MRAAAVLVLLLVPLLAGCSDQGRPQATYADHLALATEAALAWSPAAELVGAFGVERDASVPAPAWMDEAPPAVRDATDPQVGDARAPWWTYAFQSGGDIATFHVSASGQVLGPSVTDALNADGDDISTAPIGEALDPSEVRAQLQDGGEWAAPQGLASWELLHYTLPDPTVWIVRGEGDATDVLVVDAATAAVLCRGTGDVSFRSSSAVYGGQANAATPWTRSFEVADGHRGLEVQLSGSDEPLNELELTLTSPSGQTTTLTYTGGAAPAITYIADPEGGSWDALVRQTGGGAASIVLRIESDGSALRCD